jgi:NADPH2:quinone reductase
MKAIVITRLGGPEALEIREMPEPAVSNDQEVVQVEAGGLNFADTMAASGGYPGTPKPPLIAGREFCGTRQSDGVRVMGYLQWGAFAEKIVARRSLLWRVPEKWSAEEGAAFPVNFFTAYLGYWKAGLLDGQSLRDPVERRQTPRVLIHAVAGGVGTAAVQLGKILGVEMYGTSSSEEKLDRVRKLGLQHGINYKQQDYAEAISDLTQGEGVDAVFEMLGGEHTAKSIACLGNFGRLIAYGSATGERGRVDPRTLYAKGNSVHGLWLTYLSGNTALMERAWLQLSQWVDKGKLRPVIGVSFPMEKVAEAYQLLMNGNNFGKIVLRMT